MTSRAQSGLRLEGKVILITGGASGIGKATAETCARAGGIVVIADIDATSGERVAGRIEAAGGRATAIAVDVTDEISVRACFEAAVAEHDRLDGLFNNAAIVSPHDGALGDVDLAVFERVMAVNATGTFLCTREALRHMTDEGGSIVNNVSVAAIVAEPLLDAYTASKGAMLAMTRSVAAGYAGVGIRANAVCPGFIRTPLTEVAPAELVERFERETLLPIGEPDDVASAVLYLLSDESRYVTGATLVVDGGYTVR
jgi:NAD(P)-dependent dehydrogenase (short-subunit alcohol dehydrogenase family)